MEGKAKKITKKSNIVCDFNSPGYNMGNSHVYISGYSY